MHSTHELASRQPVGLDAAPVRVPDTIPLITRLQIRNCDIRPLDVKTGIEEIKLDDLENELVNNHAESVKGGH